MVSYVALQIYSSWNCCLNLKWEFTDSKSLGVINWQCAAFFAYSLLWCAWIWSMLFNVLWTRTRTLEWKFQMQKCTCEVDCTKLLYFCDVYYHDFSLLLTQPVHRKLTGAVGVDTVSAVYFPCKCQIFRLSLFKDPDHNRNNLSFIHDDMKASQYVTRQLNWHLRSEHGQITGLRHVLVRRLGWLTYTNTKLSWWTIAPVIYFCWNSVISFTSP